MALNIASVSGGLVDLGGQTISGLVLRNKTYTVPLILANGTLDGASLTNCANVTLRDMTLKGGLAVSGGMNLSIIGGAVVGGDTKNHTKAVDLFGVSDFLVQGVDFSRYDLGLVMRGCSDGLVEGNSFHDFHEDCVRLVSCARVTAKGNWLTGFLGKASPTGTHPDGFQLFTDNDVPNTDISIIDNVIWRGNGNPFQGIFARWYVDQPSPINLTVSGNSVAGGMGNGIYVCGTGSVTNNRVIAYKDRVSALVWEKWQGPITGNSAYRFTNAAIGYKTPVPPRNTVIALMTRAKAEALIGV